MSSVKKKVKTKKKESAISKSTKKKQANKSTSKVKVKNTQKKSKTLPKVAKVEVDPIDEYIEDMSTPDVGSELDGTEYDEEFFGDDDTVYPAD